MCFRFRPDVFLRKLRSLQQAIATELPSSSTSDPSENGNELGDAVVDIDEEPSTPQTIGPYKPNWNEDTFTAMEENIIPAFLLKYEPILPEKNPTTTGLVIEVRHEMNLRLWIEQAVAQDMAKLREDDSEFEDFCGDEDLLDQDMVEREELYRQKANDLRLYYT